MSKEQKHVAIFRISCKVHPMIGEEISEQTVHHTKEFIIPIHAQTKNICVRKAQEFIEVAKKHGCPNK